MSSRKKGRRSQAEVRSEIRREKHDLIAKEGELTNPENAIALRDRLQVATERLVEVQSSNTLKEDTTNHKILAQYARVSVSSAAGDRTKFSVPHLKEALATRFPGSLATRFPGSRQGTVDLVALGRAAAPFHRSAYGPVFMLGLSETKLPEKPKRQAVARREKEHLQTYQVEQKQELEAAEAAAAKRHDELFDELSARLAAQRPRLLPNGKKGRRLSLIENLIDPWSYTQSVENLFYFSFLVKEGRAALHLGQDGEPLISVHAEVEAPGNGTIKMRPEQLSLVLDMATWKALVDKYDIKRPALTHRASDDSTAPAGYASVAYGGEASAQRGDKGSSGSAAAAGTAATAAAGAGAGDDDEDDDDNEAADIIDDEDGDDDDGDEPVAGRKRQLTSRRGSSASKRRR